MKLLILIISLLGIVCVTPFNLAAKIITTTFTFIARDMVLETSVLISMHKQQIQLAREAKKATPPEIINTLPEREQLFQEHEETKKEETK